MAGEQTDRRGAGKTDEELIGELTQALEEANTKIEELRNAQEQVDAAGNTVTAIHWL